jgi:hypothetical protein
VGTGTRSRVLSSSIVWIAKERVASARVISKHHEMRIRESENPFAKIIRDKSTVP